MLFKVRIHFIDNEPTYLVVADNGQMIVTTKPQNYDGIKPGQVTWRCRFTAVEAALHLSAYLTRTDLLTHALPLNPRILLDYSIKFEEA